ncbi:hypothetical protein M3226_13095 [Neobacillus cucumis]|uniref:hypothetical protein n=1 Tax=Neobacillus cucumis TaxID=1740721 RepID=UPI00203B30CA|nr:hypothetical protein [Neobacillus cucumis]MCM3726625.1 hypothetical protein [Neobacillus cucumis]
MRVCIAPWNDEVGVVLTCPGDKAFCTGSGMKEQGNDILELSRNYWKWMGQFIDSHKKLLDIGNLTIARINDRGVENGYL